MYNKGDGMSHTYRLMQQGTVKKLKGVEEDAPLFKNITLQYMGSAEFEFGAIPAALKRFEKMKDDLITGSVEVPLPITNLKSTPLNKVTLVHYCVHKDQEEDLLHLLNNWRKECKNFKSWEVSLVNDRDFVFCIDEGYECFMWTGRVGKMLIKEHLAQVK